ncbi:hypothetical protein [Metabacillus niabensis]|uniref:hypothetical protein n=1 Tax=Metabacillus niabensis TaxID=324854 RepID=UPI0039B0C305
MTLEMLEVQRTITKITLTSINLLQVRMVLLMKSTSKKIIPLDEKAWHVQYNKPYDNRLFGDDANDCDCAIGVELCYGGPIDFTEGYKRFVWYHMQFV